MPEVVAVVVDVGGEERAVAPAEDDLLAPVRGPPIHFHAQLVGLDQPGRLGQPLADLRQEEDEPVRPGAIARERRVGLRREPPLDRAPDQRQSASGAFHACATSGRRVAEQEQHRHDEPLVALRTSSTAGGKRR